MLLLLILDPWVDELINDIGKQQKEEEEMREKERIRIKQDQRRTRRQISYEPDVPMAGAQPEISDFHPANRKDNPSMNSSSGNSNLLNIISYYFQAYKIRE